VQELLIHLHPVFAVFVFPLLAVVAFAAIPWLGAENEPQGAWFRSAPGRRAAGWAGLIALLLTPSLVVLDEAIRGRGGDRPEWLTGGILPLAAAVGLSAAVVTGLARRGFTRNERLQTVVVFWLATFAVLTLLGALCRGEGMALVWPWDRG
jgi:hypothetical protein